MRKYLRHIAKMRLKALGADRVNRKLNKMKNGRPLWRVMTEGKSGKEAEAVQIGTIAPEPRHRRRKGEKVSA